MRSVFLSVNYEVQLSQLHLETLFLYPAVTPQDLLNDFPLRDATERPDVGSHLRQLATEGPSKQDVYCLTHFCLLLQNPCHISQSSCPYSGDMWSVLFGEGEVSNAECILFIPFFKICFGGQRKPSPA